jgi:phosphatidylglycerophosphatase C
VAGLAVFDLDGTVTRRDTLLPWIGFCLQRHPWRWLLLPATLPALLRYALDRDRGRLKAALMHRLLAGLSRGEIADANRHFLRWLFNGRLFAEALERIALHRSQGDTLVLLSASVDTYVPDIAAELGFDACECTAVRWQRDGTLDGRLVGENRRGGEKVRVLRALISRLAPPRTSAYGNSSADLPHLRLVDEGWYINGPQRDALGMAHVRCVRWHRPGVAPLRSDVHTAD